MSPAAKRTPKPPPTPKPWQRAEAGRYRSSDGRFTLESGGGQWFVTDAETLDELGLARTTGPFATLDAAKVAADGARGLPTEASPLAARIAEAAARPRPEAPAAGKVAGPVLEPEGAAPDPGGPEAEREPAREPAPASRPEAAPASRSEAAPQPEPEPQPEPAPRAEPEHPPPARTWLDNLDDADRAAAVRARKLIAALKREGIADAQALVRRDLLGGTPAVATRLLARAVLAAVARLKDPSAADVAGAMADALASSRKRGGLPGWELAERDGPTGERRSLRLTADDLRAAAENEADR